MNALRHRNIRQGLAALVFLASGALPLYGLEYAVTYTEGSPYRRGKAGQEVDLQIGDVVKAGDTVITESGDYVELESGSITVRVNKNTVFTIYEFEKGGRTQDALGCALGSLRFKVKSITGQEPSLKTNTAVCGLRGTELTLFAGEDGSSLVVVADGLVEVSARGESVELAAGEGVEVAAGQAPGAKFQALAREIDFAKWNEGRLESLLRDPVQAALRVETQMKDFAVEIGKINPLYLESKAALDREREQERLIKEKQGPEAMQKYHSETVVPVMLKTLNLFLNLRYYALSALSLRRYVSGRMYLMLKSRYILDPGNPVYKEFLAVHNRTLELFEREVVERFLVQADI